MSDTKEKLKKLLFDVPCESECEGELGSCPDRKYGKCKRMDRLEYCTVQKIADHLLANGVTVQEWIPVKDRLPEAHRLVLCRWTRGIGASYGFAIYQHDNDVWYVSNEGMQEVTHWMPLPEPPKGE